VLDFDAKAGGLDALAAWEAEYGRIPGWRVCTGSGGLHIYMAGVPGIGSRKLPVLDTGLEVELKANGSQVVFAGSIHENGRRYAPESPEGLDVLAQAPGWLLELAQAA
jgi:bifunctional DNA primase/polymerase-like protein